MILFCLHDEVSGDLCPVASALLCIVSSTLGIGLCFLVSLTKCVCVCVCVFVRENCPCVLPVLVCGTHCLCEWTHERAM